MWGHHIRLGAERLCIYLIEETLTREKHKPWTMRPKCLLGNLKKNHPNLWQNKHYDMTGCINHALWAPKEENILIINKWNISQRTNAAFPEYHSVLSFRVYAFHRVNLSSIRCIPYYSLITPVLVLAKYTFPVIIYCLNIETNKIDLFSFYRKNVSATPKLWENIDRSPYSFTRKQRFISLAA